MTRRRPTRNRRGPLRICRRSALAASGADVPAGPLPPLPCRQNPAWPPASPGPPHPGDQVDTGSRGPDHPWGIGRNPTSQVSSALSAASPVPGRTRADGVIHSAAGRPSRRRPSGRLPPGLECHPHCRIDRVVAVDNVALTSPVDPSCPGRVHRQTLMRRYRSLAGRHARPATARCAVRPDDHLTVSAVRRRSVTRRRPPCVSRRALGPPARLR